MDPATGAGLAASLVTLIGLCGRGCKTVHSLRLRLKDVPREIDKLAEEVETLQAILIELQKFVQSAGEVELSPGLQNIWQRTQGALRKDIEAFESLVRQVQSGLESSSNHRRTLAHFRHVAQTEQISKYKLAVRGHIDNLNLIHNLLARQQLMSLKTSFDLLTSSYNGRVCEGSENVTDELQVIYETLSTLKSTIGRGDAHEARNMSLLKKYIEEMQWKRLKWKWSIYQLPVGILSIEVALSESNVNSSHNPTIRKKKRARVIFKYKPPPWFFRTILEVTYTIYTQGHKLPFWQRTTCGRLSLLPLDLSRCLGESDCLAIGDCLLRIPFGDILQLCREQQLSGLLLPISDGIFSESTEPSLSKAFAVTLGSQDVSSSGQRRVRTMIVPYVTIGNVGGERHRESFAHQWSEFRKDYICFGSIYTHTQIPHIAQYFPRIGLPINQDGFEDFVHYVGQHLDPENILEFPQIDHWWMSALLYDNVRFRAFISSHLASFRSHDKRSETLRYLDNFNYDHTVHQIMSSSRSAQIGFVSFLCAFGTGKMLLPLVSGGFDWHTKESKNLFLRGASLMGNVGTFRVLSSALAGSQALADTVDKDLLHEFLSNPFPGDKHGLINELLKCISHLHESCKNEFPSESSTNYESHAVVQSLLVEKPYRIATESDVGYLQGAMQHETGSLLNLVSGGLHSLLEVFLNCQESNKTSVLELQKAIGQAERNMYSPHPRKFMVIKAEDHRDKCVLFDTVHLVDEGSDVLCCWLLIIALRALAAFPEERFAALVERVTEKVGTLDEAAMQEYRKFLSRSGGDAEFAEALRKTQRPPVAGHTRADGSRHFVPFQSIRLSFRATDQMVNIIVWLFRKIRSVAQSFLFRLKSYTHCLISLSPLDFFLLVFGTVTMVTTTAEYIFWEVLSWISSVDQSSRLAVGVVGGIALAYLWRN